MEQGYTLNPHRLRENWRRVLDEIAEAARHAGRGADEVRLIAVSKMHPPEALAVLASLGQRDFGENYVQEARAKQEFMARAFPGLAVRWHAIGPVQSKKARDVAGRFTLIHSVASLKLARGLAARLEPERIQPVLVQVNIGEEARKNGVAPAALPALAEEILALPQLDVQGLMCLPPNCGEGELARPHFARLRELRDDLQRRLGRKLPHLSMGMSGDFCQAIAEGATMVRVGTAIFGSRF